MIGDFRLTIVDWRAVSFPRSAVSFSSQLSVVSCRGPKIDNGLLKERTIEFVPSNSELEELKQTQDWSWVAAFENSSQLKAVVDDMDERMKEVLYRWAFDEPWDEISGDMGVTTNALKKRFADHLKKIRSRILNAKKPVGGKA